MRKSCLRSGPAMFRAAMYVLITGGGPFFNPFLPMVQARGARSFLPCEPLLLRRRDEEIGALAGNREEKEEKSARAPSCET